MPGPGLEAEVVVAVLVFGMMEKERGEVFSSRGCNGRNSCNTRTTEAVGETEESLHAERLPQSLWCCCSELRRLKEEEEGSLEVLLLLGELRRRGLPRMGS